MKKGKFILSVMNKKENEAVTVFVSCDSLIVSSYCLPI